MHAMQAAHATHAAHARCMAACSACRAFTACFARNACFARSMHSRAALRVKDPPGDVTVSVCVGLTQHWNSYHRRYHKNWGGFLRDAALHLHRLLLDVGSGRLRRAGLRPPVLVRQPRRLELRLAERRLVPAGSAGRGVVVEPRARVRGVEEVAVALRARRAAARAHPSSEGSSGASESVIAIVGARRAASSEAPAGSASPICVFWCNPRTRRLLISATVTALLTAAPAAVMRSGAACAEAREGNESGLVRGGRHGRTGWVCIACSARST